VPVTFPAGCVPFFWNRHLPTEGNHIPFGQYLFKLKG
jgi:hypothetical protein